MGVARVIVLVIVVRALALYKNSDTQAVYYDVTSSAIVV